MKNIIKSILISGALSACITTGCDATMNTVSTSSIEGCGSQVGLQPVSQAVDEQVGTGQAGSAAFSSTHALVVVGGFASDKGSQHKIMLPPLPSTQSWDQRAVYENTIKTLLLSAIELTYDKKITICGFTGVDASFLVVEKRNVGSASIRLARYIKNNTD